MVAVGAVSAADNSDSTISDSPDDFELDEDLNDDPDDEDDDEFEDDDPDDDEDDEFEDDDEDDEEDDDPEDDDLDEDFNESDYDYLEMKILQYLEKYGNVTDENWTESQGFLSEFKSISTIRQTTH